MVNVPLLVALSFIVSPTPTLQVIILVKPTKQPLVVSSSQLYVLYWVPIHPIDATDTNK